jgi:hypothetical protein
MANTSPATSQSQRIIAVCCSAVAICMLRDPLSLDLCLFRAQ